MAERTRTHDWSATAIGPAANWPQSLKTAVSICLGSRHPIVLWWGSPDYTQFYNDAYIACLGAGKHPHWLGRSGRDCWSELWPVIGPMFRSVFETGEATWSEDLLLVMHRHLPREETYFTFSYSPIRDETGAIRGIFCACTETTGRVIGERRLRTLRDLSRMEAEAKTAQAACQVAARTLGENPADIPFALVYLLQADGRRAQLVATTGLQAGSAAAPVDIDFEDTATAAPWPLRQVAGSGMAELVRDLPARFGAMPGGPWPESAEEALVVPIAAPGQPGPTGFLVSGLSPRRVVDTDYRSFLHLVAGHVGTSIANARAYEAERQRAEALAEIDRAKTAFFSNVSHEFRTPLTLMIAPLEDALAQVAGLPTTHREPLELAHRNALRLLKLVNTLLDFSRIEAGRIQASYEAVDLSILTSELASVFRSAIERAGMKLVIDCPPLAEPVHVDREMWEKIVLNLISNAFKFTFDGEIEVSLRQNGSTAELMVRDTGTGIAAEEIPRLFERFHRIRGARGRSYEGSGIGLALVQELVKLHGGAVHVESDVGRGSKFVVSIPFGAAHLPADRIEAARTLGSSGVRAEAYVAEALRWQPEGEAALGIVAEQTAEPARDMAPAQVAGQRILLADDNTDMRDYVRRLLTQSGYQVDAVSHGQAALAAARQRRPDLVLSDVMMPVLDGFGLLHELRADPELGSIPVILLSARAGEEARIEGMHAGADDYLIKPFSARELMARVESHLNMARFRHEAGEAVRLRTAQFETLVKQAPIGVYLVDAEFRIRHVNPVALPVFGDIAGGVEGRDFDEVIHVLWEKPHADDLVRIFRRTLATGEPYIAPRSTELRRDRGVAEHYEWRLDRILLPDGRFGVVCYFRDISQQLQAEETQQLLINELNHRVKNTLASVQAIAQQTLRNTRDPADFAARFSGRIQALARVHSMLTDTTWQGADLGALVADQLMQGPVDETRLTVHGPAIRLEPQSALHIALMIHELGTNSVKYGALSSVRGRVSVNWSVTNGMLRLRWRERGGPPVTAATSRGFGTTLIEQSARGEGGSAQMLCEADGVTWDIVLALPASMTSKPASVAEPELASATRHGPSEDGSAMRPPSRLTGKRFLVVEDEALIALNFASMLERAGAEVARPVGTEKEALLAIEQGRFDGALLDANLHGRPVDEIAAALTRHNIPFIFVTGYGREGLPTSFQHVPVLGKPFSDQELIEAAADMVPKSDTVIQLRS